MTKNDTLNKIKRNLLDESGASLVASLIAIAILTVGLLGTALVMSTAAGHQIGSSSITVATHLAQEKLEDIQNTHYLLIEPSTENFGDIPDYLRYSRAVNVAENETRTLKTVDVVINHTNGQQVVISAQFSR